MGKLYVVGIGPGSLEHITIKAKKSIRGKWYNSRLFKIYRLCKTSYRRKRNIYNRNEERRRKMPKGIRFKQR